MFVIEASDAVLADNGDLAGDGIKMDTPVFNRRQINVQKIAIFFLLISDDIKTERGVFKG